MSSNNHNFFYPLIFPFFQKKWFSKTWWLNLIALVPVVNLILFSGWRYHLIKNIVEDEKDILPEARIISFFKHGVILWCVAILYLIIPMILIFSVGSGVGGSIMELWAWAVGTATQDPNTIATDEMLKNQSSDFAIRFAMEIIWVIVSIPILSTGLARYAITGKVSTLLNVPANAMYAVKYVGAHIMMWIFKIFMIIFVGIVTSLLVTSVFLAIFAPMFGLCVYYWSSGFELGHLAKRIKFDMTKNNEGKDSPLMENDQPSLVGVTAVAKK